MKDREKCFICNKDITNELPKIDVNDNHYCNDCYLDKCKKELKAKDIEEMVKVMPEKIKDPLDNSRYIIFGKSLRREIARIYYNAGYRKLPEDSVVLSREEVCELKCQAEEDFNKAYDLGSKETAERILKDFKL